MAYDKHTWQSNELITSEKLNHIEDGITSVEIVIESLNAEDVGAIKDDYSYDAATYPYTGQELILLHNTTTGKNTITDVASFLSSAGGGSGSNQGALVHYTKTISVSAGSVAQTFSDSNITDNMIVLQAIISNPAAQGGDWTFTTANGTVTLNGTVNAATNVTLYFGVSLSAAPSIQVNLASTAADNILKTNPTPGVMGVLGTGNGGTGVNATDAADLRSKLGITPGNIGTIAYSELPVDLNNASGHAIQTGYHVYTNSPSSAGAFAISLPTGNGAKLQFWVGYETDSVYFRAHSGESWQTWRSIATRDDIIGISHGGTGATNAPDARANLGAFGGGSWTNLANGISIAANATVDITLSASIKNYIVLILGYNGFINSYLEGFFGEKNVYFFPKAMSAENQYAYISPPDGSWKAWFLSNTSLRVVNLTSITQTFRVDGIN